MLVKIKWSVYLFVQNTMLFPSTWKKLNDVQTGTQYGWIFLSLSRTVKLSLYKN